MDVFHFDDGQNLFIQVANKPKNGEAGKVLRAHGWRWNNSRRAWMRGNNPEAERSLATVKRLLESY